VALITREDVELPMTKTSETFIDLDGRIEAYDISNISGTSAVGSMTVFEHGKPAKQKYRLFKIKTVIGANDYAMLEEVLTRRLRRAQLQPKAWPLPQLMVIDGGEGQVAVAKRAMKKFLQATAYKLPLIPIIGIAKGFDRKQDRLVYDRHDVELARVATAGKEIFQKVRDEAHRFAVSYHQKLRSRTSGIKKRPRGKS
jgi:excinuclease ABC subunit C